jgi:hypothetical protein
MSAQLRFGIDAGAIDQEIDAAVMLENLLHSLVDVIGLADIQRDRFGLAAAFGYPGHHRVQRVLPAPRNNHGPAICGERFRAGLADAAAAARHPGHAFPVI